MLKTAEILKIPKDDHSLYENTHSQPLKKEVVFNRSDVISEGWYPVCRSSELKALEARSYTLLSHRFVLWRTKNGEVFGHDSFCSHLGADLGNGNVVGNNLQCYFHHYTYSPEGKCHQIKEGKGDIAAYPVREKFDHIWIYPAKNPKHEVPSPPELEKEELTSIHLKKIKLFVHHHVMMAGGIDLQHFKSVHQIDLKFKYQVENHNNGSITWHLEGQIPKRTFLQRCASFMTGGNFNYSALFAGGSIVSLTYGHGLRWRGKGFGLPSISLLWGCRPTHDGVSESDVFLVMKDYPGLFGLFKKLGITIFALLLLWVLRDDDIKAIPHMRFNLSNPSPDDQSVLDLVTFLNQLPVSDWTKDINQS